jgi:DNA-binding NtrC family response regulator
MAKILVVDDDPQIIRMLEKLLKKEGHEVFSACDGMEAKDRWDENSPDLLITDIVMPQKEGLDLILEVQRERPDLKVIAISGGDRIEPEYYLELAQIIGAYKTLVKPFNPKDLLKAVNELLE